MEILKIHMYSEKMPEVTISTIQKYTFLKTVVRSGIPDFPKHGHFIDIPRIISAPSWNIDILRVNIYGYGHIIDYKCIYNLWSYLVSSL